MTIQLKFLDWDRPLLPIAADYLCERFTVDGRLDMSRVVLALPGRRAINRLEELLLERASRLPRPDWYPPQCLTLGTLPEKFYDLGKPLADDLTRCFAWLDAVDRLAKTPERLAHIVTSPPAADDLDGRLALGRMFDRLHRELAADDLDFSSVAEQLSPHLKDERLRWDILSELQDFYLNRLDRLGVWDIQSARRFAIHKQKTEEFERIYRDFDENRREVFLVGLVDMNRAQKAILKKFEKFVTALVFAPERLRERFDEFGCLAPDAWSRAEISLDESQIAVVERPENQADTVVRCIDELNGRFASDRIVVGVPDAQIIPLLKQRFELLEIESRHFEGTPMTRTEVYRFLDVLRAFLESRLEREGFAAFAELIRHPNVQQYLRSALGKPVDLLSELDGYHSWFLPETVGDAWKDKKNLSEAWEHLKELLGFDVAQVQSLHVKAPLRLRTRQIGDMLKRLYGASEDRFVVEAGKHVQAACRLLDDLSEELLPGLTLTEVIRLLLTQLESKNIPPHDNPDAIEMIGWLEIVMDDAPVAIVTGMNDGIVPSFLTADLFLPDTIRRKLGIEDNHRRYARDAYALSVILETREKEHVRLIGSQRSIDDDPLLPSRLFFATDNETVAHRVLDFFDDEKRTPPILVAGAARPGRAKESGFRIPELVLPDEPPDSFRVTEFRSYVSCPYRYFLRHRLELKKLTDDTEELDPGAFGNLVHHALEQFGRSGLRDSDSADDIRDFLTRAVREHARNRYGDPPLPAVAIQIERALKRLDAFADWQVGWRAKGWRIRDVEYSFGLANGERSVYLDVDGSEVELRGRIDRIDVDKDGNLYVFDYKTSDSESKDDPKKVHRKKDADGVMQWVDFQLPLYHYILRSAGEKGAISLAYIMLPNDTARVGVKPAKWTDEEIADAVEAARNVVRRIRRNDFTPIDPPPMLQYDDFAAICLNGVIR